VVMNPRTTASDVQAIFRRVEQIARGLSYDKEGVISLL
jgi:hypothetical protein